MQLQRKQSSVLQFATIGLLNVDLHPIWRSLSWNQCKHLFIVTNGTTAAHISTIHQWECTTLKRAGIDLSIFKPHSTHTAAASAAYTKFGPLQTNFGHGSLESFQYLFQALLLWCAAFSTTFFVFSNEIHYCYSQSCYSYLQKICS